MKQNTAIATDMPELDTLSWLLEQACSRGADSADAVMLDSTDLSASVRLGKPEGLERAESKAVGLRAFVGQRQAIVSATDTGPASLKELAERAVSMARVTPPDAYSTLAQEALYCRNVPELDLLDADEPDAAWLTSQCRQAEEAALAVKGITNSEGADTGYSKTVICLAVHDGKRLRFAECYRSSYFALSVSVLAGEGTGMERDYDYTAGRHRAGLLDAAAVGRSASQRAVKRLHPRKVSTCEAPVVFDPRVSRSLLSTLAGAISGSAIARGSSFLKHSLHERIFAPGITIVDDPHIRRGLGSRPFDDEGVINGKRTIVEDGVLTTWLLDTRTANKLKMTTTGHASRGISSPPSPSPSNLYMEKGVVTPDELIEDIKSGLYITETFGVGINTTTGDYSQGASGFWIENGELAYPVSEITIAGSLRDMFKSLIPANDLVFRYATNAPTLRIDTLTIAGT